MGKYQLEYRSTIKSDTPLKQQMESIAFLGTSADPPTCGHEALLEGLLKLFPRVITWASNNPTKKHIASLNQRQKFLHALVQETFQRAIWNSRFLEIKELII